MICTVANPHSCRWLCTSNSNGPTYPLVFAATEAAEVAQDVLSDDVLQEQLDQLAKMLIASLLNDPATVDKVTSFVQQILGNQQINDAVLAIVLRVIHDERTVDKVPLFLLHTPRRAITLR